MRVQRPVIPIIVFCKNIQITKFTTILFDLETDTGHTSIDCKSMLQENKKTKRLHIYLILPSVELIST